jgi:hypothetical protein
VVAIAIDRVVNLNRFSMHTVYRNRLVREFLGPARPAARAPDTFTQFDPNDNVRLAQTWEDNWQRPLFPVINLRRLAPLDGVFEAPALFEAVSASADISPEAAFSSLPRNEARELTSAMKRYGLQGELSEPGGTISFTRLEKCLAAANVPGTDGIFIKQGLAHFGRLRAA